VMRVIHPVAGMAALLTIAVFWTSTVVVEAAGSHAAILAVKTGILWGMLLLIPSMALAGASGFRMGGRSNNPRLAAKWQRMPMIALNGLLVLVPCAFFLQARAAADNFGGAFPWVQGLELAVGAVNLTLMALNLRDGLFVARRTAVAQALRRNNRF
jgi:hypothetical protein